MASIIIDEIVPTKWRLRLRDPEGKTREVEVRAGSPVQLDAESATDNSRKHEKPRIDAADKSRATDKPRADRTDKARAADKPRGDSADKARTTDKTRTKEKPQADAADKARTDKSRTADKARAVGKDEPSTKAEPKAKTIEEKREPPSIRRRKPEPGPGPGNLVWEPTEDDGVPGIRATFERGTFKILHAGGDAHGLFYEWNSGKYQTLQCGPLDALKQAAARWTEDGQLRAPRSNLGAEAAKLACATKDEPAPPKAGVPTADTPKADTPKPQDNPPPPTPEISTTTPVDPEKDNILMQGFEASVQKMLAARKGAP